MSHGWQFTKAQGFKSAKQKEPETDQLFWDIKLQEAMENLSLQGLSSAHDHNRVNK